MLCCFVSETTIPCVPNKMIKNVHHIRLHPGTGICEEYLLFTTRRTTYQRSARTLLLRGSLRNHVRSACMTLPSTHQYGRGYLQRYLLTPSNPEGTYIYHPLVERRGSSMPRSSCCQPRIRAGALLGREAPCSMRLAGNCDFSESLQLDSSKCKRDMSKHHWLHHSVGALSRPASIAKYPGTSAAYNPLISLTRHYRLMFPMMVWGVSPEFRLLASTRIQSGYLTIWAWGAPPPRDCRGWEHCRNPSTQVTPWSDKYLG